MKLSLLKLTLLCFLILTTTAYSQEQGLFFNFFGGGARSEGMGEAYIALSDGAAGGGWNPAGLYLHERTFMGFSYGFLIPRGDYEFYVSPARQLDYGHDGTVGGINNWSIITPMRIKGHPFVFNISTTRFFDVYYRFGERLFDWSEGNPSDPTDDNDPNAFYERTGGINSFNLGFGTRLYKRFSFGAIANIYFGSVVTDETRLLDFQTTKDENPYLMKIDSRVFDSTSYSGFNMTLGLKYDGEKLKAGLMARTPFTLRGNSDTTLIMQSTGNGVEIDIIDSLSPFRTQTVYVDNKTSKMDMPLMIGFGLAYNVKENWIIAGDAEFRGFGGKKVQTLDSLQLTASGDRVEYFSEVDPNWSDVWSLRIGMEYTFNTKIGQIPVRIGARKENLPEGTVTGYDVIYQGPKSTNGQPDPGYNDSTRVFYSYSFADNKTRGQSLSFGTGIHWSQIMIDIAYTYTNYEQGIYRATDLLRSKNIWKNHHLNFSFTGYF